jgi:hypothetical protein
MGRWCRPFSLLFLGKTIQIHLTELSRIQGSRYGSPIESITKERLIDPHTNNEAVFTRGWPVDHREYPQRLALQGAWLFTPRGTAPNQKLEAQCPEEI